MTIVAENTITNVGEASTETREADRDWNCCYYYCFCCHRRIDRSSHSCYYSLTSVRGEEISVSKGFAGGS